MHIGIDATSLPPRPVGAGNYIIQLIRAFAEQPGEDTLSIFSQPHGWELINIPTTPSVRLVSVPSMQPAHRLLWEQAAFPDVVRNSGVDLLHSLHYTMPLRLHCPSVVTIHDLTYFLYPQLHIFAKRHFFRRFILTSGKRARALVADSESTRQDAIRLAHISPQKIFTALLGVTPDFQPISDVDRLETVRKKYNLPTSFFLHVGLLEPRKNLPALLRAFATIKNRIPGQKLVIVGRTGWKLENLRDQVKDLELSDRVIFAGYVEQADLPAVYNLADVFVYPSLYEGFGLPVLEAMACGTPVITSNVSSMPEICGEAGVQIDPKDEGQLAQSLLALLNDPEDRKRRSLLGVERAAQFTWQRTAAQTRLAYRYALGN